jgi:peroxiredoxin
MKTMMNYGILPERKRFCEHAEKHFPYRMTVVRNDIELVKKAIDQGIDSHLEAVFFNQFNAGHKLGIEIKDAESMHILLRRLIEIDDESALEFASCVMETLGYEWV